jgi:hypothetical protein
MFLDVKLFIKNFKKSHDFMRQLFVAKIETKNGSI